MYPKLINQMKDKILSDFKSELQSIWMIEKESDIKREVTEEKAKQKTQWLRTHQVLFPLKDQETVKVEGFTVDKDDYASMYISESSIRYPIEAKYKQQFLDDYWNSAKYKLQALFSAQIDALQPERILERFIARHPWLEEELLRINKSWYTDFKSSISYRFLLPIIKDALNKLDSPRQSSWTWSNVESLITGNARWSKIDESDLALQIEGYPLSSIQGFYHSGVPQLASETEAIQSAVDNSRQSLNFLNHSLKRVDVFRHIAKIYPNKAIAENKGGIDITRMAPFSADELVKLSPAQLNHLESMLVNIGSEAQPIWICLSKAGAYSSEWEAYVPASLQILAEGKLAQFKSKTPCTIKNVDFNENAKQNDIQGLNDISIWHSILFGRVLPWTQNKSSTLATYRNKIPVSLLLEYTLKSCLPSYTSHLTTISSVFARRKPLSDADLETLYSTKDRARYLLEDPDFYDATDREKTIIDAFDTNRLEFRPISQNSIPDTLKLSYSANTDTLKLAQFVVYHNPNITKLITPALSLNTSNNPDKGITRLFNYNTTILTAKPLDSDEVKGTDNSLSLAMECAARNRFLANTLDVPAWAKMSDFSMRPKLWDVAGREMVQFFAVQGDKIDLDFINEFQNLNTTWSRQYFDHEQKPKLAKQQAMWNFAQFAQMGTHGLDVLFQNIQSTFVNQWESTYKEPAPNLPAVFDLSGSLNNEPKKYTEYLKEKIRTIGTNPQGCSPIFKSLSLIAPSDLAEIQNSLVELFEILDEQKKATNRIRPELPRYVDAVSEITLYNININDYHNTKDFLERIEKLAKNKYNPLQILIRIPTWDRAAFTSRNDRELKAKYKEIQDLILENQRQAKLAVLTANTKNIHLVEKKEIKPEVIIKEHEELKPQPWDGEDVSYPLAAQTPGIQQQLQQAIEQEYEQEEEQQQEQEQEQEQEIAEYKGDEGLLITRFNIDEIKGSSWKAIPETKKAFSGWAGKDLKQLFSLWVGSEIDAANVIKKIEPAAVEKIMEYAADFRFGASRDNLPAGFYLAYSRKDRGLILCFDRRREKLDLITRAQTEFEKRNHFTVQFYTPAKANIFRGDYRQFSPISTRVPQQKLFYKFLVTEDTDGQRLENAFNALGSVKQNTFPQNASVQMQEYTISGTTNAEPGTIEECRLFLKEWAKTKINAPKNVLDSLFESANKTTVLSEANLRAFGQLFYDHEVDKIDPSAKNASHHFLVLAQQIFETFGPEHFETWKKYILDPSQNYSELLAKDEINRVALSIATIGSEDKKPLQNIWWALIEAHGKSTGFTRYGPLWESFQTLLEYAEKNELIINADSMIPYLKTADNFNAQVFLDRLHRVLRNTEKGLSKREVQQDILDHIHQIDWRHNGFYYASRYENHPYWSPTLKLSLFTASSNADSPSYIPQMDRVLGKKPEELLTTGYRFISQRMKVLFSDFYKVNGIIRKQFEETNLVNKTNGPLSLRLLVACLSQGTDRISELDEGLIYEQLAELADVNTTLLKWINDNLHLDGEIIPGSLNLKFEHIATLIKAIKNAGIEKDVLSMSFEQSRQFINDCGRALKCYSSSYVQETWFKEQQSAESTLSSLFVLLSKQRLGFDSPLLSTFPWLYFDHERSGNRIWNSPVQTYSYLRVEQPQLLRDQMKSIDFARTRNLPTYKELATVSKQMDSTYIEEAKHIRQGFIKAKIQEGCAIMYQDAAFRPLEPEEIKIATDYMAKHLKVNFKSQNLKLCEKFFNECVAVEVDSSAQKKRLDALLLLLTSIDNKPYYNDLGQVLGLLIEYSKKQKGQQKYYSLEQVTSWLDSLLDPVHMENAHFPINILTMILDLQLRNIDAETNSTLLNGDLNQLKTTIEPAQLRKNIVDIVRSEKLPSQYKPVLAKYALHFAHDSLFINKARGIIEKLHKDEVSSQWLKEISEFIGGLEGQNATVYDNRSRILNQITGSAQEVKIAPVLNELWQETQIKLIDIYQQKNEAFASHHIRTFDMVHLPKDAYIRMIILQAITDLDITKKQGDINLLKAQLQALSEKSLQDLAEYCKAEPRPSIDLFTKLLTPGEFTSVEGLIHRFETVEQATKPDGTSKRYYSINAQDNRDLLRVFSGLTQKGQGVVSEQKQKKLLELLYYVNNYSQVANLGDLSFNNLQQELLKQRQILQQLSAGITPAEKELASLASARLLACMREILLRKTGKWVNHTQMLDLIYAALHNDEKLVHQVRTGQGKSIISMMRVSYLALNGKVVDLFSSKDSLSKRDQQEFSHVLDAMGVRNSYITPSSPVETYQTNDSPKNVGAVNFCTIGNSSLFQSTQIWQHIKNINLDPKLRVAFVDECDFVLKFEDTQFNYSANSGAEAIYNFDEWVYRIAYKYYLEHFDQFPRDEQGVLRITRFTHLQELCELLQKEAINSPKQSEFLAKFVNPAANNDPKAIEKRDNELKKLLVAAHVAQGLKEGRHYSIRPDQQIVGERTVINTRFAKVLIGNQIKHGSTYSDLVQQFLHVRLNEEAVAKGEAPNFFVEPDSTIALSSNAKFTLKKYYNKIEGCTGTAGNLDDLKQYEEVFGITHVVKLPSHEELRTKYVGTIYSDTKKQQVSDIIDNLIKYADRPILVTCEDDIEVKKLFKLVQKEIERRHIDFDPTRFIQDTNDSGLAESDIVPKAGAAGKITISSRMGRGTDIKPETEAGLMVLRTYPTLPQITKQELGRQGRNGALGTCIEIIDYSEVQADYQHFTQQDNPHKARLETIMHEQRVHLELKFQKHNGLDSNKWKWLEEGPDCLELQERYLRARSLQQLKYEIKKQSEVYLRRKEFLIASLSGDVIDVIHTNYDNSSFNLDLFKDNWLDCRKKVEALWNVRLAGKANDSDEIYAAFIDQVADIWHDFCLQYSDLNQGLFVDLAKSLKKNATKLDGPHDQVLKFIKDHIEILTLQKDQNKAVSAEALVQLKEVKQKLKKIYLKYHPDKVKGNFPDDPKNPIFDDIVQQSSTLLGLIDDTVHRAEAKSEAVQQVQNEKHPGVSLKVGDSSALVLHKPVPKLRGHGVSRDPEFKSVISFYQEWVKGAELNYFSKPRANNAVIHAIYGPNNKYLDYFYEAVYEVSHNGNKTKREQLFTALTELKKPQLFLIPAKNIADVAILLSEKFSDPDYDKYLLCLKSFFELKMFEGLKPKLTKPEDLVKFGLLFDMAMNIATNHFIASDNRNTIQFMTNLCNQIHNEFWDKFDDNLAHDLVEVFAYSPEISSLLSENKLDLDLHHFINLVNHNKDADKDVRKQRIEQLGNYLDEHHEELADGQLGVLRPLFQMTLGETQVEGRKESYLPDPQPLARLPKELQKDFWNFISQRQPVTEKAIDRIVDILKGGLDTEDFKKNIFTPLIELDPYVSMEYIIEHLKSKISQTNCADAKRGLIEIHESAEAFNKFTRQVGLIASDRSFSHETQQLYDNFVQLFNQMTPEQSKLFFNLCAHKKYAGASLNSIAILGKAWANKTIKGGGNELVELLTLAVDISKLYDPCKQAVEIGYNKCVGLPDLMQVIQGFVSKTKGTGISTAMMKAMWDAGEAGQLKTEKELDSSIQFAKKAQESHALKESDVNQIYKEWLLDAKKDEQMLEQSLQIMQEIAALHAKYSEVNLLTEFMSSKKDGALRTRYLEFLAAVKDKEINEATMVKLAQAWITRRITSLNQLNDCIKTIEIAQGLQKNGNWADYFMHFVKNSKIRQKIMQVIHHGILDLGKAFADKCYNEYEKMVGREIKVPELSGMNLTERRRALTSNYRKIVAFTEEISNIDKNIIGNASSHSPYGGINAHKSFFSQQQKAYDKEWWRSSERKEQANTLFANLGSIQTYIDRAEFFKASLDQIWSSQKEILDSDRKTKRNAKGYSRLYDITVQMSIYLANEFIKDPTISIADKMLLNQKMQEQMEYHINLLGARLPKKHEYKDLFTSYSKDNMTPGSTDLEIFQNRLRHVDMDSIPKHLRYLMTNIECFVDISRVSPQMDMANKENYVPQPIAVY